jgi:hypothetical protein
VILHEKAREMGRPCRAVDEPPCYDFPGDGLNTLHNQSASRSLLLAALLALAAGAAPLCGCHSKLQTFDPGTGGSPDLGVTGCGLNSCAKMNASCGAIGDGCSSQSLFCGACPLPQTCGGGGTPFQCGGTAGCIPKTCAQLGFDCGYAGDGCGGVLQCGSCVVGGCGGGGKPNVCGGSIAGDSQCAGGAVTTISGTVVSGTDASRGFGNPDPLYHAYVYVPSGPLGPMSSGATCQQCSQAQAALVSTVTGVDGKFLLINPPTGANVTVVIQLGKWRRVLTLDVTPCVDNPLSASQTRLPRKQHELSPGDNIPRFAVDTGNVDVPECVLRKLGIADSEFTDPALDGGGNPTGAGRVHLYQAHPAVNAIAAGGAVVDNQTPTEESLWSNPATLDAYDAVLFPCEGAQDDKPATAQSHVVDYTSAGGRIFASHFSYVWLYNNPPFSTTASWAVNTANYQGATYTGIIDQSFPKGVALAQWLKQSAVGASTVLGQIPVGFVRHDFDLPLVNAQRWMYMESSPPGNGPGDFPVHYSFNTPVGASADNQCGRVVFSDLHIENTGGSFNVVFPNECAAGPMTAQEKLLEFMLFDLTSCVAPDEPPPPPNCTKQSCTQIPASCGTQSDGCGGTIDCGSCPKGQTCGGGGVRNQCGAPPCNAVTCAAANAQCGIIGDGCGGTVDCGSCPGGKVCGGGGVANQCAGGIG